MGKKFTVTALVWDSYAKSFRDAGNDVGADVRPFTRMMVADGPETLDRLRESAMESDIVIAHMMGNELPEEIADVLKALPESIKVLSMGKDPLAYVYTTGPKEAALKCREYLGYNGRENCRRCLLYLMKTFGGMDVEVPDPLPLPSHGIFDPSGTRYDSLEEYIGNHGARDAPWVGIIASRAAWINDNYDVEAEIFRNFESRGYNVIMIFAGARTVPSEDILGLADAVAKYMFRDGKFLPSAIVKCSVLQFGESSEFGKEHSDSFLRTLNVPIFQPIIPSSMSRKTFEESPGLKRDVAFAVTFQEFEGTIEPILIGFAREDPGSDTHRTPIPERVDYLVKRVIRRMELQTKPNRDKKVAFILNNYPCANADANIGEGHNLNVMESLANILLRMKDEGYTVDAPETGKGIMDYILAHKAVSDFRWTDSSEIERCGGVLHHMTVAEYREWFDTLSDKVRADVIRVWGEPPGESMVRNGDILITGVRFGNVLMLVQPKRGCYGPKCDGTVCRVLHDPVCPPTHQYLATYHWLDSIFKTDAIVHTGTHGNMENLPGKGVGLTADCYPDICIGTMPHLYIFDAGAVPPATAAKRRGYGTLIDHMPPAMERVKAYGPIEDLRIALNQYESSKNDPLRAEEYHKILRDAGLKAGLDASDLDGKDLQETVKLCTEEYSRLTNTHVHIGLHVMGEKPDTHMKATLIMSIIASGEKSVCGALASSRGIDYTAVESEPDGIEPVTGKPNGLVMSDIYDECLSIVESVLSGGDCPLGPLVQERILSISSKIDDSDEIGAFINALAGGFTPPGPCGLVTRGREEVLPTGRNPFIIDPRGIPTRASWKTGVILGDKTIEKYKDDTGEIPESVSLFWMSSDLMNEGGEMMSQMMYLMGVKPVWAKDGQVEGFEIIPLEELGRPRIDVTVRCSGILMDTFSNCLDIMDDAVVAVSALDEPPESNFVKKHTLASMADGIPEEDSTARFFSSAPGAVGSGVPLAIYANAWKTERDLADIYIATNGYAYGNNRNGKPLHQQFMSALSSTSITYTKMGNDEHDILGSGGFFGNIGGMSNATKIITGRDIRSYFGDTRFPGAAGVRTLKDEVRRITKARLLNPQWIEGMKAAGYQGAAEIMKRSGRVYGFGATTDAVDDRIFDDMARTFVNDPEMREFFRQTNPFAGEEIARRLLEANERGFWKADPEVLEKLKNNYLVFEGDLEGIAGDGEYQGSSTEIAAYGDVDAWKASNGKVMDSVREMMDRRTGAGNE